MRQEERDEMRLATAIRMGSLLIDEPCRADVETCAIGMACKAIGHADRFSRYQALLRSWPWLKTLTPRQCPKCEAQLPMNNGLFDFIAQSSFVHHLFDGHVFGDRSMTIEQLCDFIDSIDPTPRDSQESVETTQEVNTEKVRA